MADDKFHYVTRDTGLCQLNDDCMAQLVEPQPGQSSSRSPGYSLLTGLFQYVEKETGAPQIQQVEVSRSPERNPRPLTEVSKLAPKHSVVSA
jgi:hypothetical protein